MKWHRPAALVAAVALLGTACSGSDDDAVASTTTTEAATTAQAPAPSEDVGGATIGLTGSEVGEIVVDDSGFTLYLYLPDAQGESTCYDDCEAAWPVLGEVTATGEGVDSSLLGTIERSNGDLQATYNGWPLYYFANDAAAGDTNGQGLGDVWYVLDAAGDGIGI